MNNGSGNTDENHIQNNHAGFFYQPVFCAKAFFQQKLFKRNNLLWAKKMPGMR